MGFRWDRPDWAGTNGSGGVGALDLAFFVVPQWARSHWFERALSGASGGVTLAWLAPVGMLVPVVLKAACLLVPPMQLGSMVLELDSPLLGWRH